MMPPELSPQQALGHIVDINESNAQQALIEESQKRLVVAAFWSPRSPSSAALVDIIAAIADTYQGDFLLAKVNADEQAMIAQQLGVRGLPTVMLLKDGQPIDGFAGEKDEAGVKAVLEQHLPKPWDKQKHVAEGLIADGDFRGALEQLQPAYSDSGQQSDIGLLLAHCLVELFRLDEAENILNQIPMVDQDTLYQQLVSQIELKRSAAESPEITALKAQAEQNPDDLGLKLQLAVQYHSVHSKS